MSEPSDPERDLADERSLRSGLERRLAAEVEKASLWRARAEERAARIERLESEGPLRRLARSIRMVTSPSEVAQPKPATEESPHRLAPSMPVVRVGEAVTAPFLRPALDTMSSIPIRDDARRSLFETDVVVIESAALSDLPSPTLELLESWAITTGRPPLVVLESGSGPGIPAWLAQAASVIATTEEDRLGPLGQASRMEPLQVLPTFDPLHANPRRDKPPSLAMREVPDETSTQRAIREAASGLAPEGQDGRLAVGRRRWAYRYHAPWVRASELLRAAGVDFPDPIPIVAGLLVSRRPDKVASAAKGFLAQSQPRKELVVGLHGFDADLESLSADSEIPVTILRFPSDRPLGACLNDAAAVTGAPILAKIDDDDHYGPGHIEDAVHALRYSGAGVVGKAAMFVYLADRDLTVLRRVRDEERMISGTMPGGTFVMHRRVWDAVRFPHRPRFVDAWLLEGARSVGEKIYSNSRWEFCLVREENGHTYQTEPDTFVAGSTEAWQGFDPSSVETEMVPGLDN
ncbi:MAG: hypothetical protein WB239_06605 [Acidimicrobiia bacterium]